MADDAPTRRFVPDEKSAGGLVAGRLMFSRYVLEAEVGRGGMGVVWRARDDELEREVALKFLPEVVAGDVEALRDLKRETRRCLELTHPFIVRVYDFVAEATAAAIAMELVDGQSLSRRKAAARSGCLEIDDLAPLAAQICTALDYAHRLAKVVHRDLKPANILVTRDGVAKITDFGIARSLSDTHTRLTGRAGQTSGTLAYMSPQQLLGGDPSSSDDIYALGATFYELLTGKPPFVTGDLPSQIREVAPKRLNERRVAMELPPVPDSWEQTVLACLAKEPSQRPRSVGAIAERLQLTRIEPAVALVTARPADPVKTEPVPDPKTGAAGRTTPSKRRSLVHYPAPGEVVVEAPSPEPGRKKWQYDAGGKRKRSSWLEWVLAVAALGAVGAYVGGFTSLPRPWLDNAETNTEETPAQQTPATAPADAAGAPATENQTPTGNGSSTSTVAPAAPATPSETPAAQVAAMPVGPRGSPFPDGRNAIIPDLNLALIWIQAGRFTMGSPRGEPGRDSSEGPLTAVTISRPFWLGQTEVTQAQWTALMADNPSFFHGASRPVEQVSWHDAMEYCRRLTAREQAAGRLPAGYAYTLPTEAEWEYACRAGTTGAYAGDPDAVAWYDENGGRQTHPVRQKQANSWELYDMEGNVCEWCRDSFGDYSGGTVTDPVGSSSDPRRVVRGGSWNLDSAYCRSARRGRYGSSNRFRDLGFRIALEPLANPAADGSGSRSGG